jgi:O-antigen/teichoic acid export membrane protein
MFSKATSAATFELVTSNVITNATLFLGVYAVSQIVTPTELGIYSAFSAIVLAVYPAFTLRYEQAAPIARNDRSVSVIFVLCILLSATAFLILLLMTAAVFHVYTPEWLRRQSILDLMPLLWLGAFTLSVMAVLQMLVLRAGAMWCLAAGRVLRALTLVASQLGLIWSMAPTARSLVIGEIIANVVLCSFLIVGASNYVRYESLASIKRLGKKLVLTSRRYRTFALVNLPHALSHMALVGVYATALGALFGASAMGQYFLMRKIVFGTISLFSMALNQVATSEAVKTQGDRAKLWKLTIYIITVLGVVTSAIAVPSLFFGGSIFAFIFGANWQVAGELCGATFGLIVLEPIVSTIAFLPIFTHKQKAAFAWSMTQNVSGILALVLAGLAGGSLYLSVLVSSTAVSGVMVAYVIWLRSVCLTR